MYRNIQFFGCKVQNESASTHREKGIEDQRKNEDEVCNEALNNAQTTQAQRTL